MFFVSVLQFFHKGMLAYVMEKIKPLFDRVLLSRIDEQEQIGTVIVPKDQQDRANILQVENQGQSEQVKKGDRVIVAKYAGTDITVEGKKYLVVCEHDIIAVIKGEQK